MIPDWAHRKHLQNALIAAAEGNSRLPPVAQGFLTSYSRRRVGLPSGPAPGPSSCASRAAALDSSLGRGTEPAERVVPGGSGSGWPSRYQSAEPGNRLRLAMVLRNKLSCFWILGFCLVASKSPPTVPSINDRSFIDDCLAAHNEIRGNVEPPAANMKHMVRKDQAGIVLRYLGDYFYGRI